MDTPGLKFICRDIALRRGNKFDLPLSSRFDEQDAFVIFDDVEVPRDRVFIDANLAVYNSVMATGWYPNIMQQTMIRAHEAGIRLGPGDQHGRGNQRCLARDPQMLGEIWTYAEFARAAIHSAELGAFEYGNGVWLPNGPRSRPCARRSRRGLRASLRSSR